jgi:hypothetical protein
MIFGPDTRVEQAPRDKELSVWEHHRPLLAGVPG